MDDKEATLLPWGLKMRLTFRVPRIVPVGNKRMIARERGCGRPFIMPNLEAQNFCKHIAAVSHGIVAELRKNPEYTRIHFPIDTGDCPMRIDSLFCFRPDGDGQRRMKLSDADNLRKGLFDGIKGVLVDDDRGFVEGYFAKGLAPVVVDGKAVQDEFIFCVLSRAGYRKAEEIEVLLNMPIFPPWRPEDQGRILRADTAVARRIITDLTGRGRRN